MEYIIDGNNLVLSPAFRRRTGSRSFSDGQAVLLDFLQRYGRKHLSDRFLLVFDGAGEVPGGYGRRTVSVIFSAPVSADTAIRRLLCSRKADRGLTVVSDDREVRSSARIHGAVALGTERFVELLIPARGRSTAAGKEQKKEDVPAQTAVAIERELRRHYLSGRRRA